jgi:hypothetical protein
MVVPLTSTIVSPAVTPALAAALPACTAATTAPGLDVFLETLTPQGRAMGVDDVP